MTRTFFFLLLFLVSSFVYGEGLPLKKTTFLPQWKPQAQFAGFYVAKEKGFYERHGIDLILLQGGPSSPSSAFLLEGKADFATMWLSNAIRMRSGGHGIVNVGQIMQRSALMLVAKKSSGILRAEDINDKKVGLWGEDFQIQPRAFFKKYDLHVKVIPQSFSVNLFLRDGVEVASAMWYNEYHTILNAGLNPDELTSFFSMSMGWISPRMESTPLKRPL
jgi:NitT/TauT family transport system substrate-binding protein